MEKQVSVEDFVTAPYEAYDKRDIYNEQLRPLVSQLFELCAALEIPMFFAAGVQQAEDGISTLCVSANAIGIERTPAQLMAAIAMARCDVDMANTTMAADRARMEATSARLDAVQNMTRH